MSEEGAETTTEQNVEELGEKADDDEESVADELQEPGEENQGVEETQTTEEPQAEPEPETTDGGPEDGAQLPPAETDDVHAGDAEALGDRVDAGAPTREQREAAEEEAHRQRFAEAHSEPSEG